MSPSAIVLNVSAAFFLALFLIFVSYLFVRYLKVRQQQVSQEARQVNMYEQKAEPVLKQGSNYRLAEAK